MGERQKLTEFFDQEIEPKAICGNCDYHSPSLRGHLCSNTRSLKYATLTWPDDGCGRFWPDSKRWPEADHG